jgi:hypothetical protein
MVFSFCRSYIVPIAIVPTISTQNVTKDQYYHDFRMWQKAFVPLSTAAGPIGPPPSSRCAAAALRFARFAVTAPVRCGGFAFMIVAERTGLAAGFAQQRSWRPTA